MLSSQNMPTIAVVTRMTNTRNFLTLVILLVTEESENLFIEYIKVIEKECQHYSHQKYLEIQI
jgi:hypothetical protein